MDFSLALESLKLGQSIARAAWVRKSPQGDTLAQHIVLINSIDISTSPQIPDVQCLAAPFFVAIDDQKNVSPWLPSHGDLLAEDWTIFLSQEST